MKRINLITTVLIALFYIDTYAQSYGTMQIYKGGKLTNSFRMSEFDSLKVTPSYFNCGKVKDYDGNVYTTVIIGTQCWMQQNLNTTHYRTGQIIPNVKKEAQWDTLTKGAYCNYNNDTNIAKIYGRLYNWYAVIDSNKLCPTGWHIPSISEWKVLVKFLGDTNVAGGKMKEASTLHWQSPNVATNSSGFTALPGGYRNWDDNIFNYIGGAVSFWSTSKISTTGGLSPEITDGDASICMFCGGFNDTGFSVRCVKGN